jgi:hypothetical protein
MYRSDHLEGAIALVEPGVIRQAVAQTQVNLD